MEYELNYYQFRKRCLHSTQLQKHYYFYLILELEKTVSIFWQVACYFYTLCIGYFSKLSHKIVSLIKHFRGFCLKIPSVKMNQSIFIVILSFALVQAYPGGEIPETRATATARTNYQNVVNGLNTKTTTGSTAITKALGNTTINTIASLKASLDYLSWNINTAKTQSSPIGTALNADMTATSPDKVLSGFMACTSVLNTTIVNLGKISPNVVSYFQTSVNAIVQNIYTVYFSLKSTQKANNLLSSTAPDTTYALMGTLYNTIATMMNDLGLNYTNTLLNYGVVVCADYGSNGVNSSLYKIITNNNKVMNNSMIAAQSTFTSYIPDITNVLPSVQNGISEPFSGIQQQSLAIEQQCKYVVPPTTTTTTEIPTTTTDWPDCTVPARRSYESWGLGTYTYACTWSLQTLVDTFDSLNDQITTTITNEIATATSYISNEMNQTFAYINSTAASVASNLLSGFGSSDCTKLYQCANTTYINLANLVMQTHNSLTNCMVFVPIYMQTNATQIIMEYTVAENDLTNAVYNCSINPSTFDSCLQSTLDPTFPNQVSSIQNSLTKLVSTGYQSCRSTVQSNFDTAVQALKDSFDACYAANL